MFAPALPRRPPKGLIQDGPYGWKCPDEGGGTQSHLPRLDNCRDRCVFFELFRSC